MTFLDKIFKKFNIYVLYIALAAIIVTFGYCFFTKTESDDKGIKGLQELLVEDQVKKITYAPHPASTFMNITVVKKNNKKIDYSHVPMGMLFNQDGTIKYPTLPISSTSVEPFWGYAPVINVIWFCLKIIIIYCFYLLFSDVIEQFGNEIIDKKGSKKRRVVLNQKRFTFQDVAGADEEKEEMSELIDFLKNPRKYDAMGARIPKGVLLYGPPGTGKTLLAKAVAGEAGVPFFASSGSDFDEVYVGLGASRVRDLFKEAQLAAPCIVFIDEIEAIARKRGVVMTSGGGSEQTLNQLLVEMDGFNQKTGVIVIAATNQPEALDAAILRPGRFDRHFNISLPNVKDREAILKLHASNKKLAPEISLEELSKQTPGFSGAQLEGILNEAALLATRRNASFINKKDISEALDRVLMGPAKKSRKYIDKEKRMVAYHEAGHAVIGIKMPFAQIVQKITIIPRGNAGGYNLMLPLEETFFSSKKTLLAQITSFLGGRVAEELMFDDVSSGSFNDFKHATQIAKLMVTKYGMSDLGPVQYSGNDFQNDFSDPKGLEIDQQIQKIIVNCFQQAKKIIEDNKDLLTTIAQYLLEIETLTKKDIDEIVATSKISWWEKEKELEDLKDAPKQDDQDDQNDQENVLDVDVIKVENSEFNNTSTLTPNQDQNHQK
ncbi:ATP-dependent zinc metalloprotease FtsH ['Fragaria x ananassa' phyllody phytoplasma]|uniref:ATP-dependent zinc metalloprotease FtsH n=1 Tax='Fragaria x ananassa' phyllody phytoplasma TaxID=2358428 RepID=A0ABS5K5M8_9MOLU|nr:ATP-dependent zinc metalloprotease FtsH ['Fragaria x ananassa' phyllody phytoplasma]MBS2126510.1 ATP-dependent zinc metalloprotease FtsH ['Fragaria x ananassa' phyllody phytoplasma]